MSTKQLYAKRNEEIKTLWDLGFSRGFIAEAYSISKKQVRKIVNRSNK